jgi:hypothetical protein
MSPDPNKKTPRSFQCRESLWQKFEQMARELECSVDYLINDAMKQYARQRGYSGSSRTETGSGQSVPSGASHSRSPVVAATELGAEPHATTAGSGAHHVASGSGAHPHPSGATPPPYSPPSLGVPPPARPSMKTGAIHAPPPMPAVPPPAPPAPGAKRVQTLHNYAAPPPIPGVTSVMPPTPPPMPGRIAPPPPAMPARTMSGQVAAIAPRALLIRYQGQLFPVNKDRFIIGRGKQTSDLTIKDPNVSRQHAMIEFANGQYFISDMGSTNGIEYQGQRVQRRAIVDGDVVKICDHELTFSFR